MVASPEPLRVLEQASIAGLVEAGTVVVCGGGGGVPVFAGADGELRGAEAVVDKDLTAALLAIGLGYDVLGLPESSESSKVIQDFIAAAAGTYSARVMIHHGFYSGIWYCGGKNYGGVMQGRITKKPDDARNGTKKSKE